MKQTAKIKMNKINNSNKFSICNNNEIHQSMNDNDFLISISVPSLM